MSDNSKPHDLRERFPTMLQSAFDVGPPPGWVPLVARLLERIDAALDDEVRPRFRVTQVKEKFAGLRVYHNGDDTIEAMVDEADEEAQRTCDMCGQPGSRRGSHWVQIRCDEHAGVLG